MEAGNTGLVGGNVAAMQSIDRETALTDAVQSPAYTATITTTVVEESTTVVVGTLTGNITIAAPLGARKGMDLTYCFTQDATGTRTVTWNAAFSFVANEAGAANEKGQSTFIYDGARWIQMGGSMLFNA